MAKPQFNKTVYQYLECHAEPESRELKKFSTAFRHCLVIPIFAEKTHCLSPFETGHFNNVLVIAVVNTPDRELNGTEQRLTKDFLDYINGLVEIEQQSVASLYQLGATNGLLLIERTEFTQAIPVKQGVGLARKIGCDCAVKLLVEGMIRSPIIHSTDADAVLPKNYFSCAIKSSSKLFLYQFLHQVDATKNESLPALLYDFSLQYYVIGLKYASSPYAFFTIGSLIAFHCEIYCNVRGFSKRAGGEDFYFLNKASKLAKPDILPSIVKLSTRKSTRVPFGTGPGIRKLAEIDFLESSPIFYNPQAFSLLKIFLAEAADYLQMDLKKNTNMSEDHKAIEAILILLKFPQFLAHCRRQRVSRAQFQSHFTTWFDAFKTLKFIHHAHEIGLQKLNFNELKDHVLKGALENNETYQHIQALLAR